MTLPPLRDWQAPIAPAATEPGELAGHRLERARWTAAATAGLAAAAGAGAGSLAALRGDRIEAAWCETVESFRDRESPERAALAAPLAATCRLSPPALDAGLEAVLGGVAGASAKRLFGEAAERPAAHSPALVILASNLPALAVQPLLPALALGRPTVLKSPTAEPLFAAAFAAALIRREPRLDKAVAALTWPGGDRELEAPLLAAAGRIVAYGEQDSLDDLERRAPGKVTGYGPMASLAVVDAACDPVEVAPGLARDIALFDQRGCLSIHAVYTDGDAEELAVHLAEHLADRARRWPPFPADAPTASAVQQVRAEAELNGWTLNTHDLAEGTVVVDPRPLFQPSPGLRTVRIHPLPSLDRLPELLTPWAGQLQGVAISGPGAGHLGLSSVGITRTARPGELQTPDTAWHNGGRHPLEALADPD